MARCIGALMILLLGLAAQAAEPVKITVRADQPGKPISPTLYGIFVEDINRALDGGLYAEMVQNRSFEDAPWNPGWSLLKEKGGEGTMALDTAKPLNANNPTALKLTIAKAGGRVGVYNEGFKGSPCDYDKDFTRWEKEYRAAAAQEKVGLAVRKGMAYRLSLYARAAEGFAGPLRVSLERPDGTVLASREFSRLGEGWKKLTGTLKSSADEKDARLVLSAATPGTVWLDMVSLFPGDAINGLWRPDLYNMLKTLKPGFIRFPGGCFVEGNVSLKDGWRWKETLGDVAERPGHWDQWGYRSTDGIGIHEYLQLCEDFGAAPLLVVSAGIAHKEVCPMDKMGQFVQDALDAIEYANGPVTSKWGALRAKNGHPKSFGVKIVSIGNENDGPAFEERYALYYDAIRKKYPEIKILTYLRAPSIRPVDIVDEHPLLSVPEFFYSTNARFAGYDRKGPKIFLGESSCGNESMGMNNLHCALAEAVFQTELAKQSDVVIMRSYAVLMCNPYWRMWNPNQIYFDGSTAYGSPSYHVAKMIAANRGDMELPVESNIPKIYTHPAGQVGIGAYGTITEYRDLKVTGSDGKTLFDGGQLKADQVAQWEGGKDLTLKDGILRPAGDGLRTYFGDRQWHDYTFTLKARPETERSTAAIFFNAQGGFFHLCEWYVGGDGTSRLKFYDQDVATAKTSFAAKAWHDLRVETKDGNIRCLVDGKVVHELPLKFPAVFVSASREKGTNTLILKAVNISDEPLEAAVDLAGIKTVKPGAKFTLLTGPADGMNSFEEPNKVHPVEGTIDNAAPKFTHTFPARSLTVMRLKAK